MKAIYQSGPDCNSCMQLGWAPPEACAECLKLEKEYAEKVDILQFSYSFFGGNKAVIKRQDGSLATVPISDLTITD